MGSKLRRPSHVLMGDITQKMSKWTEYITYFSCLCDRMLNKSNLRKEGSVYLTVWGDTVCQGGEAHSSRNMKQLVTTSLLRMQRERNISPEFTFSFVLSLWTQPIGLLPHTHSWHVFPAQLEQHSHRYAQGHTQNPVKFLRWAITPI